MNQPDHSQNTGKRKKDIIITDTEAIILQKKLRAGRLVTLGCYSGLLVMFALLNLFRDTGSIKLWLVQSVPLLIFIPALRHETHRSYSWLCFVALMYFVAIIPLLMGRWWWSDWLITLLVTLLFIASMMTSRWLQYWNYYLSIKRQSNFSNTAESSNT